MKEKMFCVTEVPVGATAEETETHLNEMDQRGYLTVRIIGGEEKGLRIIWKLRTKK